MSDLAHLLPRCPRCGFGLRLVRGYWWCDACKTSYVPPQSPSLREVFREAADSLKRFFSPSKPRRSVLTYPRASYSPLDRSAMPARCPSCGALTPREFSSCVHCGTTFGQPPETPRPISAPTTEVLQPDETVYRYIVDNGGEISLSRASADLHVSIAELQASIGRLESTGKIMRDGSRNRALGTG